MTLKKPLKNTKWPKAKKKVHWKWLNYEIKRPKI